MDLIAELKRVTGAFDEAGLTYALCGGLAVAVHGAPRATTDLDLRPERRLDHKIDYSPAAVKRRLEAVEQARRACFVLAEAGEGLG